MKLTDRQQEVVDCQDREILVTAGAGSGKTSTTVERYRSLLSREPEPLSPREILVFTFTDKAAGELREKVRAMLSEEAEATGGGDPNAVSMSNAWVGTFHSICNRILKAWPMEAEIDPGFTVLDSTSTETLTKFAFDRALARFFEADEGGADLVARFNGQKLRETITWAYDELRSRGIEKPRLPEFDETPFPSGELRQLRDLTESALKGTPTDSRRKTLLGLKELLSGEKWSDLKFGKTAGLRAQNNQEMVKIETAYRVFCEAVAKYLADPVRRRLGQLLEIYGEEFSSAKASRSVLDYDDLQLVTLRLLRDHPHIKNGYRERFREIMVDEFQDTNGLQIQLIRELQGEGTTLLTVGDEIQSIYGFRHADVALFRTRRDDEAVTRIELLENFRSQKSIIEAINLVGTTFDREVSERRGLDENRHTFEALKVGLTEEDPAGSSTTMILTDYAGWKELELGEMAPAITEEDPATSKQIHHHEAEALALAHHLRDLVDDETKGINQGDIAILLRARTRSSLYVKALEQVGLSPYVVSGGGFWKMREAVELRSLLSVIANPLDDNELLGALASPACGLSTDALWLISRAGEPYQPMWPALSALASGDTGDLPGAEWLGHVPDEDRERAARFVEQINSLRRRAKTMPLATLVECAVTETGYDLADLLRDPTANGLATIRRVESLAHEYEAGEGRSLRGFLDWSRLSEELDSEAAAATADEDSDVVRVMTIHAAKGLQFKVTCVPDLGRSCKGKHDPDLRLGRSGSDLESFSVGLRLPRFDGGKLEVYDWEALAETAKAATEYEELRLLHVALTRAENHLVISGVLPAKLPEKKLSHASPMIVRAAWQFGFDPADPSDWDEVIGASQTGSGAIRVVHNSATEEQAARLARVRKLDSATSAQSGNPPLFRPDFSTYPDVPLSFTAFSEFVECPARFYAKRVLKIDSGGSTGHAHDPSVQPLGGRNQSTRFGSAVHELLEVSAGKGWSPPSREDCGEALRRHGLKPDDEPEGDLSRAVKMVGDFIKSNLGEKVRAGDSAVEVPLVIRYQDVTIRGSADLIVRSLPPLIVDYKTNRLEGSSPEEKMAEYELQRGLYALALARARSLEKIDTAYAFLEKPDQPVLKTYTQEDFNRTEEQLRETLSEITSSRFFGGPEARHQPCGKIDCPGCDLLKAQIERASA